MATVSMPLYGCEHINEDVISKIRKARNSPVSVLDPDFTQYTCLTCPTSGSFTILDKHFSTSKHEFAVTQDSIYCATCQDLIYDPHLILPLSRKRKADVISDEDELFISQNTNPKPCGREGVRGLFNLGETCYMNAVLQMMVHNQLLTSYFLGMGHPLHSCPISKEPDKKNDSDDDSDEEEEKDQKTCVACAMTELFSDAHMPDQTAPAHAVNLLFASWKHIPDMAGKSQQDAQEWFTIIIDKLHDSAVNPAQSPIYKPPSAPAHCPCFFHKVFYGRFYSDVTCDTCHKTTTTESEYSSIDLDFQKQKKRKKKALKEAAAAQAATHPGGAGSKDESRSSKNAAAAAAAAAATAPPIPTLTECLRSYTAPEVLTGDASIDCGSCETKRSAHKRLRMRRLPAILTMHVKRFGMKKSAGGVVQPEKYEGKLDFPLTVDMAPYTMRGSEETNGSSTTDGAESEAKRKQFWYDLDCVVVHQGDHAHTGHYYAFCRNGAKWFRFDDEIVSATTTEDVLRQEAYLLFYGLRDVGEELETNGDA